MHSQSLSVSRSAVISVIRAIRGPTQACFSITDCADYTDEQERERDKGVKLRACPHFFRGFDLFHVFGVFRG